MDWYRLRTSSISSLAFQYSWSASSLSCRTTSLQYTFLWTSSSVSDPGSFFGGDKSASSFRTWTSRSC